MFEFAISQHQKHPPSRRFFASLMASCILHAVAVLVLIEYPELLSPGLSPWLKRPSLLLSIFSRGSDQQQQDSQWRTVTFVGKSSNSKMVTPSAETLRRYMYDWSRHVNQGVPPVHVRWGNEKQGSREETSESADKVRPVPGTQEPKPVEAAAAEKPAAATQLAELAKTGGGEAPAGGSPEAQVAGAKGTLYLPTPQPGSDAKAVKKVAESSPNTAPASIPAGIQTPAPSTASTTPKPASTPQTKTVPKTFEDEQRAIRTEGNGLFDTRGFPLGEYADIVIERVKGNWLIPSNLRNSQGRTTVIFYIDRDGRFNNARIVTSSGSSSLDLAALNAVIESNPFPPLPKGFPGDHVGAKFVFSYNERQ
jgi:TonB family protein